MNYTFGTRSKKHLRTLDPKLQEVLEHALSTGVMDFTILVGYRGEEDQNAAYAAGNSYLKYPQSRHNSLPSQAVDVAPYPIDWKDTERFAKLAGVILASAALLSVDLEWGGDWKTLKDMPHFEIKQ